MTQQVEFPDCVFKTDIKIEQTSKGARVTVHARDDDGNKSVQEAIRLYINAQQQIAMAGYEVAAVEVAKA